MAEITVNGEVFFFLPLVLFFFFQTKLEKSEAESISQILQYIETTEKLRKISQCQGDSNFLQGVRSTQRACLEILEGNGRAGDVETGKKRRTEITSWEVHVVNDPHKS